MKKVVILVSGRGSNMQALVRARIPGVIITAVISNWPHAAGLTWAKENGIQTIGLDHSIYTHREAFDLQLITEIDRFSPDLLVLAGYMRILSPHFVQHYSGKILNIHPSLLPAFPGLHTHQRMIAAGVKIAGCTVHFVVPELDCGPIVIQAAVPVRQDDTPDTLAERILVEEHRIYPLAVRWFAEDRLEIREGRVFLHDKNSSVISCISK